MKAHKARQTLETLIKMKARKKIKSHKTRKIMRTCKARKKMQARKARKKIKEPKVRKKQQHEGTQTHKAREHVSHVGTRDT